MTTYLGKNCSFGLPRVPFVNCRQFMYLVISLLVYRAGCGIWLYQFLIIVYLFTLDTVQGQCQVVEACLRKNNSKKAYQLVKDLTTEKQGKSTTIQDKSGKCLTEENEILNRVLLKPLQPWDWWGPISAWLPTDARWRASPYSTRKGGSSSQSIEDGKVSRHG